MKTTSVVAAMAAASTTTLVDPSVAFSPPRPTTASPQSSAATTIATRTRLREQRADGSVNSNSNNDNSVNSRRNFLERLSESAAVAASAVAGMTTGAALQGLPQPANAAIKTGAANSFTGDYDDPNHPGCLRQVKVVGAPMNSSGTRSAFPVIEITGYDNESGESKSCKDRPPTRDSLWQVKGSVRSPTTAKVDFSLRGGPDEPLSVTYENGGMVFPDGNKWKKIPEQADRRPKDMSTLNDGPRFREKDDDDDY